jgi:hypothetical protein
MCINISPKATNTSLLLHTSCLLMNCLPLQERELFDKEGASEVGIFRLAPDRDVCDWTKKQMNRGEYDGEAPVNVLANLIKVFYRELNPNLLNIVDEDLLTVASTMDPDTVGLFIQEFPEPNKSALLWLLDLMAKIVLHESENRMGVKNMAIVMSPNLFSLEESADPMRALMVSQKVAALVINMLKWRVKLVYGLDVE